MGLSTKQKEALECFKESLRAWSRIHSLVSKSQTKNLDEHISDSLSVEPFLGEVLVDIGSGGGFPGVPIAIASNSRKVFLVESNSKRAAFLLHTTNKLGLKNTTVLNKRAQELLPSDFPAPYEIITRAFGTTNKTIEATKALLLGPGAKLRMMKTEPPNITSILPWGLAVTEINKIQTKEKEKQRILVTIERLNA